MVGKYRAAEYDFLAITDHVSVTPVDGLGDTGSSHCDVMRLGRGDAFSAGGLLLLHPGEEASLAL